MPDPIAATPSQMPDLTLYDPASLDGISQGLDSTNATLDQLLEQRNPQSEYTMNKSMWPGGPTYGEGFQYGTAGIAAVGDIWNGYNQMNAANTQASFLDQESQINLQRATQTVGSIMGPEESFQLGQIGGKGEQVIGAQRAIYAVQGVNVNTGSAAMEQEQTGKMTNVAEANQRTQDALKAYGVTQEAQGIAGQQQLEALGEEHAGEQSLLLGGSEAFQQMTGTFEEASRNKAYFGGM